MVTPLTILSLTPEHERRWWAGERPGSRLIDGSNPEIATRLRAGEALVLEMAECPSMGQSDPSNTQIMLLAPMRIGEWLVGVMMLARGGTTNRYTEEEIALAKAVARLGALVIERERLLREREEARANELALRETTRQMDVFMGMASHELKTPLTTIILGLQAMQRRLHSLSHDAPKAADAPGAVFESLLGQLVRTRRQVGRLNRLVDDLLDVSRIQAGKLELRREPADLALLLREILEEQRQAHPQRSIQLHLPAIPAQPVMADVGRIGQVVTNYLTNALKYSAEDSPVEVGFEVTEGSARVWVRDQGPGLPQDEQERIWERFHRAKGVQVRSGTGVGLGLGLYISQTIIERHQGHVGVESAPGKGSTFWFTLPFVISVQAE